MTKYQDAKRRATWLATGAIALAFMFFFFALLPAIGGRITAEQPISTYQR